MTNSIGDILNDRSYQEPDEIVLIKNFIQNKFNENCSVKLGPKNIVIIVNNAALASSLRFSMDELKSKLPNLNKQIVIRIQ